MGPCSVLAVCHTVANVIVIDDVQPSLHCVCVAWAADFCNKEPNRRDFATRHKPHSCHPRFPHGPPVSQRLPFSSPTWTSGQSRTDSPPSLRGLCCVHLFCRRRRSLQHTPLRARQRSLGDNWERSWRKSSFPSVFRRGISLHYGGVLSVICGGCSMSPVLRRKEGRRIPILETSPDKITCPLILVPSLFPAVLSSGWS